MNVTCENYQKCPIYSGVLQGMQYTAAAYRRMYCDAGSQGWSKCRRYQVKERLGRCPEGILPNATMTVDEIVKGEVGA